MITTPRWKGGTSNDKKYFSEKVQEKVLTTVKRLHIKGLVKRLVVENRLYCMNKTSINKNKISIDN